jgi:IclR family KDG regulon transcriptional repressor
MSSGELISIVSVEANRNLRLPTTVGRRSPLYCTSQGKAILAFFTGKHRCGNHPRPSIQSLHAQYESASADMQSTNEELEEDLRCVGAPVFNHAGEVIAALSIAGPIYRVGGGHLPRLIEAVVLSAHQLSAALGFH